MTSITASEGTRRYPFPECEWKPNNDPQSSKGRFPRTEPTVVVDDGIRYERDVTVQLRDGTRIFVDVYRPDGAEEVPAIIAWSPYGKREGYALGGPDGVHMHGVPSTTVSPGTKGEGPDPDYWCRHGYSVVNVDARGAGYSEGDVFFPGRPEGEDACDVIEWAAKQEWCSGSIGMSGSSWLANTQWFAAAEQPPALKAIAPWEGYTDFYRHLAAQGGIPEVGFNGLVRDLLHGHGRVEDIPATSLLHPLIDEVWEEKIADLGRITVPAYITAGWSHFHLLGSIKGFRDIASTQKWLRVHRDFEWPDTYVPEHLEDLRRFFDRFLKNIHNGWEMTPPVRIDVMDAGEWDWQTKRPEREFPLARTSFQRLYLHGASGSLSREPKTEASSASYDAQTGCVSFVLQFDEVTEITGYMKLRLWVEARGTDDADIFVTVQKLGVDGNERPTMVLGSLHPGAWGRLRASHRELDEEVTTDSEPFHTHRREQPLSEGEIVPLDIDIWPTSRIWHAGESLRVLISGHYIRDRWFEPFEFVTRNAGQHVVHTGAQYDSHLLVPVIPRFPPVAPDYARTAQVMLAHEDLVSQEEPVGSESRDAAAATT